MWVKTAAGLKPGGVAGRPLFRLVHLLLPTFCFSNARAYGKFSAETKANLERGTALPDR